MAGPANNPVGPTDPSAGTHAPDSRLTSPLTQLLCLAGDGDPSAREQLWRVVYTELKHIAASQLAAEHGGLTLAPTILVHEAFLRLVGAEAGHFANRRHFFAAAARAMRCIRIDDARKRKRQKRGGGERPQALGSDAAGQGIPLPYGHGSVLDDDPDTLLAVDEVLDRLKAIDPRKHEVVELRYFAGLTVEETAAAMGISARTVNTNWRFARAWLHRELGGDCDAEPRP